MFFIGLERFEQKSINSRYCLVENNGVSKLSLDIRNLRLVCFDLLNVISSLQGEVFSTTIKPIYLQNMKSNF